MHKVIYSVITHIPIIGSIYKIKTTPMFCSFGAADGVYDLAFKLIKEYEKEHPNEQITRQLVEKLVKEYCEKHRE